MVAVSVDGVQHVLYCVMVADVVAVAVVAPLEQMDTPVVVAAD